MGAITSQITSLTIVYSTVYSDADERKHQSSASLAFVRGIHRGPVNSPHKWPVTRKMFPFDDVFMYPKTFNRPVWLTLSAYITSRFSRGPFPPIYLFCQDYGYAWFIALDTVNTQMSIQTVHPNVTDEYVQVFQWDSRYWDIFWFIQPRLP